MKSGASNNVRVHGNSYGEFTPPPEKCAFLQGVLASLALNEGEFLPSDPVIERAWDFYAALPADVVQKIDYFADGDSVQFDAERGTVSVTVYADGQASVVGLPTNLKDSWTLMAPTPDAAARFMCHWLGAAE